MAALPADTVLLAYVLAFGAAAAVCFLGVPRARSIDHAGTRRGLVALLLASGAWASAHVGFLLAPTPGLKLGFHYAGLIIGLGAVGPWLYFCSAYTGRRLHRSRPLRRLAAGGFLAIVAVKFTNPIHGLYFRTAFVETPFPHLTITNGPLHWVVMGLAYALSAVGYFMLLELFWQVGHETRSFVGLVGLTGLPILLDIAGATSPLLLDFTYEPLGVAAFSVGVLFVYLEDFQTIRVAGERDDPVIVLDDDNRVRDYNDEAAELFPELTVDERVDAVVPEVAPHIDAEEAVVEIKRVGGMRYYQLSTNPFSTAGSQTGRLITLTDITEREQYRSELERQNERLERFASVVSHDLRNPLSVAKGRVDLAMEGRDDEDLEAAKAALERMETLVEDLLTLARDGQPISETEPVTLSSVVDRTWEMVETEGATLLVEDDLAFEADPDRLQQLLENLVRNSVEHGGAESAVTIRVGALDSGEGFYVADDGPGIPTEERDDVFSFGYSTAEGGTGFGLAIVKEIAEAHGWTVSAAESAAGGARFEVTGVRSGEAVARAEATDGSG